MGVVAPSLLPRCVSRGRCARRGQPLTPASVPSPAPAEAEKPNAHSELVKRLITAAEPAEHFLSHPLRTAVLPAPPAATPKPARVRPAPKPPALADAKQAISRARITRVNVGVPLRRPLRFNIPERTADADEDQRLADEAERLKREEMAAHERSKEKLRRERAEERRRRESNDRFEMEVEELRKRVEEQERKLRQEQQARMHDLYFREWNRTREIRDAEERTKALQKLNLVPGSNDEHGAWRRRRRQWRGGASTIRR